MPAQQRLYLDHNASAPLRDCASQAMTKAFDIFGNPSSLHVEGRAARALVEEAREAVAALVGARAQNVVFTSGASESAAMALSRSFRPAKGARRGALLMSEAEHLCVLQGHRFEKAQHIPVDGHGLLGIDKLEEALQGTEHPLMALHLANNETGVVQDVAQVSARVHEYQGLVFCDAVQGVGKIKVDIAALKVDALALSSHKLGGPKGVGALVLGDEGLIIDDALIRGGGQERGWRAGTLNTIGIAGFGAAAKEAALDLERQEALLLELRHALEAGLQHARPDIVIFGAGAPRLPNTTCYAIPGMRAETALIRFDLEGIALSSGSACSSGKVKASHVLEAMQIAPDLASCALRISLGRGNSLKDVERFLTVLKGMQ